MEIKCFNCGAIVSEVPPGAPPGVCHFCGAPRAASPFAPAPTPVAPPVPSYQMPPAAMEPPRRPNVLAVVIGVWVALLGAGIAGFVVMRQASGHTGGGVSIGSGLPVSQLATLSMKQTPESMAKVTGVQPERSTTGEIEMRVPLSGGAWDSINISWDAADPTHAKQAYVYTSAVPADDAAIRQRLAKLLGRRLDKNGSYYFHDTWVSYSGTSAYCEARRELGSEKFEHWKDAMDAAWDALRSTVLGLPVTVSDVEQRDWLGRGYTLQAIAAVDPSIDVDHAQSAMAPLFPGAASEVMIGLRFTLAVDHPWYGEAELTWANAKGGTLQEMMLRPPPQNDNKFTSQADVEACVQAALGKPSHVYEGDHLKGDHSTEWHPAEGGSVRVYEHMVDITLESPFSSKKMSRAGWTHVVNALDACGKRH